MASSGRPLILARRIFNPTSSKTTLATPPTIFKRHESSARRLTKRLRLPPDASFQPLPSASIPNSYSPLDTTPLLKQLQPQQPPSIIYNPPSSMPSVYETPSIFLPPTDKRKHLPAVPTSSAGPITAGPITAGPITATSSTTTTTTTIPPSQSLPPVLRQARRKTYHLTDENISEMRSLRKADPITNSRSALAKKYNTTRFFVGMVAEADEKHKQEMFAEQDKVKESWGKKRTEARKEGKRRRSGWGGRDQA